ncbi:hypothetical protein J19TS2_32860 [Cohnella xylanilytica]|uniref:Carrier domain-containing protein n=1 Tax=Cohnella xylanilytica TaxID=557555 RepID=A0A841TTA2_9BACL|nr:phosphopantetheine-binding protein [Cohnella xylanilytica]MBB6690919.1 hypothetical protein [Cohnella xylanilytica]GIO13731.1 hypothetical protein J19TS2_32860 [Cohnella xylanilytica]
MSMAAEALTGKVVDIIAGIANRPAAETSAGHSLAEDLGIDSILMLELLARLEEEFGFELEIDDLRPEKLRSVEAVVRFVREKAGS